MSVAKIITGGFGSFGSVGAIILAGFEPAPPVPLAAAPWYRTLMLKGESRTLRLPGENRTLMLPGESRTDR